MFFSFSSVYGPLLQPLTKGELKREAYYILVGEKLERQEKQLSLFLKHLGYSESSNNYEAHNSYGYMGKYQFGYAALSDIGRPHITYNLFVRNPGIWCPDDQELAMREYLEYNTRILAQVIRDYDGQYHRGIYITKSGILAAAHLAGAQGVRNWFNFGYNARDAFGTTIVDYMTRFSGYDF